MTSLEHSEPADTILDASENIANYHFELGNLEQAKMLLERLLRERQMVQGAAGSIQSTKILVTLGNIYQALGETIPADRMWSLSPQSCENESEPLSQEAVRDDEEVTSLEHAPILGPFKRLSDSEKE